MFLRSGRRGARIACLSLLLNGLALTVTAQATTPDRSSPRATFDSFLSAMIAVKQGDASRMEEAVACLDLSSLSGLVRDEAGPRLAGDLKNYLDKTELIDVSKLPVEVAGDRWVFRRTSAGEISLTRTADGPWLFSTETIEALPDLLDSVRDRGFVSGIEGGGGISVGVAGWLRSHLPPSLRDRGFILENWQWLALLALILIGVVVDLLTRFVVGQWLRRLLAKSEHLREKKRDADFSRPIGILAMGLTWYLLLGALDLPIRVLPALRFATQLIAAGAGVWAAYRLVDVIAAHFMAIAARTDTKVDDILIPMIRRALKILVVAFGLLFVAQNLDIDVTSLLAGLGIGGVAFALAAKDTVENLFGSFTVLIDRPFQIGDWVVIEDLEGTVEEIGFRSTRVRTFYNSLISVPNSRLIRAAVDNLGARSYRRLKMMIGVQYDTPPDRLEAFCEGIRELIRRHPYTRKDYYMVYFNEFAASSLNILLYTFFRTPDWPTELRERHRLLVDIVRLAHRLGIDFAFPTQTMHLASVPTALSPHPDRVPPTAPMAERESAFASAGHEEALRLGRAEAQAIMERMWPEGRQQPVDFDTPERMPPRAGDA